jgi:hypothetical protein
VADAENEDGVVLIVRVVENEVGETFTVLVAENVDGTKFTELVALNMGDGVTTGRKAGVKNGWGRGCTKTGRTGGAVRAGRKTLGGGAAGAGSTSRPTQLTPRTRKVMSLRMTLTPLLAMLLG